MRQSGSPSITALPDYDAARDPWGAKLGAKRPSNAEELLAVLKDLAATNRVKDVHELKQLAVTALKQSAHINIKSEQQGHHVHPRSSTAGIEYGQHAVNTSQKPVRDIQRKQETSVSPRLNGAHKIRNKQKYNVREWKEEVNFGIERFQGGDV